MCPLCDDYRGKPSSVEAHISRMTDPIHQGEVGRAHRDELQRGVEDTSGVESSDDQAVETTAEVSTESDFREDGGPQSEDTDTTETDDLESETVPTEDELERQRDQWSLDEDRDDQEDDVDEDRVVDDVEEVNESMAIPLPVSKGTLVVGAVVLLALYWFVFVRSRSSSDEDEETAQQGQQNGMTAPETGGLVGADR